MLDDEDVPEPGLRRNLLDDLRSISTSLDTEPAAAATGLDIPVLHDIVDVPRRPAPPVVDTPPARPSEQSGQSDDTEDTDAIIAIEAARIVDELVDEVLPLLEARLRERLDALRAGLVHARRTNNDGAGTAHDTGN